MIETNEYLDYDYDGHYYFLKEAGLTLTSVEANLFTNPSSRLKRMGMLLHDAITESRYNAKREGMRHIDLIEYKIYKNLQGERDAVLKALIYFAELSAMKDHDLEVMEGMELAKTIQTPLRNANILFAGEMLGYVPLEEYRVGY